MMKHTIIFCTVLCLSSCSRDPVLEVPGHLTPGNSINVAQQAIGGGSQGGLTLRHTPVIDYHAPNVPVMQDGVVDVLYGVARESKDGESLRGAHFLYIKVQNQSFTQSHQHSHGLLGGGQTLTNSKGPNSAQLGPQKGMSQQPRMRRILPHTTTGEQTTRVTFVEMDETKNINVLGSQEIPKDTNQNLDQRKLQNIIQDFNGLYEQNKKDDQNK